MTKPHPERKATRAKADSLNCLERVTWRRPVRRPMFIGDRLSDETGDYEVIGRPYTTAGGKNANVRVRRVGSEVTMIRVWGMHERGAVKRGNLMAFLSAVVAVVLLLLTAVGCSSVSVCLEQEKGMSASEGISASEDARSQGCAPNRPTR